MMGAERGNRVDPLQHNWTMSDWLALGGMLSTIVVGMLTLFGGYHLFYKGRAIDRVERRLADPAARKAEYDKLSAKTAHEAYFAAIRRLEGWVDSVYRFAPRAGWRGWFTFGAFNRCLQIAILYPMLVLMVGWALGASGAFGPLQLLPDDLEGGQRWLSIILAVVAFVPVYLFWRNFDRIYELVKARVHGFITSRTTGEGVREVMAERIAAFAAFAFAAFGFAFAAFAFAAFAAFAAFGFAFAAAAVAFAAKLGLVNASETQLATLIVFAVALPLVNALFDWLSVGATRWFLAAIGKGESKAKVAMHIALDLVFAILFLIGLAIALPAATEFMVRLFDIPFDWRAAIARAHLQPWPHAVPLLGMLVTTLAPSIVHLGVGLTAIFASASGSRVAIATKMEAYEKEGFHTGQQQEVAAMILKAELWYIPAFMVAGLLTGALAWLFLHYLPVVGPTLADTALWAGRWAGSWF
ncbi:MAG: hypothetical protein R3D32_15100 [Nitratireductor sp.]